MTAGLPLYLVFVASWLTHLSARIPLLGAIGFDMLLAALLGALAVLHRARDGDGLRVRPAGKALIALCVYVAATLPLVEWPGSVLQSGIIQFAKAIVFYAFTVAFVRTRSDLRWLVGVFVACQVFRIAEPVYLHWSQGYWGSVAYMEHGEEALDRLAGAPHDVINPNGLAFVICSVLPFVVLLGRQTWTSWLFRAPVVVLGMYALMLTGSRTGMLGLLVVYAGLLVKSRARAVLLVGGIGLAAVLAGTMSADLADRYLSLVGAGERNEATVVGRLQGIASNFEVAMRRPLFGHGLGTSAESNFHYAGYGQISHNLYAEIAQELGFIGLALFGWLVAAIFGSLRALAAHRARASPAGLVDALQLWFAVMLLFSLASYGLSSYEWYLLAGLSVVASRLPVATGARESIRPNAMAAGRPVIYVDFERSVAPEPGSIGASGGLGPLRGEPAPGAIDFLQRAVREFAVVVHSPRCASAQGQRAVSRWLEAHGAPVSALAFAVRAPVQRARAPFVEYPERWPTLDELAAIAGGETHGR